MDTKLITKLLPHTVTARVRTLVEVLDYNINMMNIPLKWAETKGEGVRVVVLDTGFPTHPDLIVKGGKSFIPNYYNDKCGHSTFCAGIIRATLGNSVGIAGIAPLCDLYCGAVLSADGSGTITSIVEGIYWAVDTVKAHIINMSLGIAAGSPVIKELERACDYAASKGVIVVAAAGNESGAVGQPASYESVIAVAAIDKNKNHAYFSNIGTQVDFATGGVDVFSTYLDNGYAKMNGTSFSSPALSGVIALIIASHLKKGEVLELKHIKEHVQRIAFDLGPKGFDPSFGWGVPVFSTESFPDIPYTKKSWWTKLISLFKTVFSR